MKSLAVGITKCGGTNGSCIVLDTLPPCFKHYIENFFATPSFIFLGFVTVRITRLMNVERVVKPNCILYRIFGFRLAGSLAPSTIASGSRESSLGHVEKIDVVDLSLDRERFPI